LISHDTIQVAVEEVEGDSQGVERVEDQGGELVLWEGHSPEVDQVHQWGALEDDFKLHWNTTEITPHTLFLYLLYQL